MTEREDTGLQALSDLTIRSPRKAMFTRRELDLRRAARLSVFSSMRDRRTIIRLSILLIGTMVALVAYLRLVGILWAELREYLPLLALVMAAATFGTAFIVPLLLGPIAIRRRFRQEKFISDYRYQIQPKQALTQEQVKDIRATLSALSS